MTRWGWGRERLHRRQEGACKYRIKRPDGKRNALYLDFDFGDRFVFLLRGALLLVGKGVRLVLSLVIHCMSG